MKSPRIVLLAMFAMAVSGGVETASADTIYSFTTVDVPGAGVTYAWGINDSGQIVGASSLGAFLDTGGSFTTIDVPGVSETTAFGINDSGQIVGSFGFGVRSHGFLDTGGSFTTIDVPGAAITLSGINNSGQIVGYFIDATGQHGFLATPVPDPPSSLPLALGLVALSAIACRRKRAREC
jgi:hypothetical protein